MKPEATSHERASVLAGDDTQIVRSVIHESWLRARGRGLAADRHVPPVVFSDEEIRDRRRAHPLEAVWPLLRWTLQWATTDADNLVFISDVDGHLLWVEGLSGALRRAERVHLVPGARWSEADAGTSGVGTALALGHPVQVRGAEHYLSSAVGYTCTAVPIRDPVTNRLIGSVDVTSATTNAGPMVLSLLASAGRLAESELRARALRQQASLQARYADRLARHAGIMSALVTADGRVVRCDPPGWLPRELGQSVAEGAMVAPNGRKVVLERLGSDGLLMALAQPSAADVPVTLKALGHDRALLTVGHTTHELSRRHSELVSVLAAHPGGLNAGDLANEVYGGAGRLVTLRAELSRLRKLLGPLLASDPYRFTEPVLADFTSLQHDLSGLNATKSIERYPGPLLPSSQAPGVKVIREHLHERVRENVLRSRNADALRCWLATRHGRDDPFVSRVLATVSQ